MYWKQNLTNLKVSASDAWGSCYCYSYSMTLPDGLFSSVMGVSVSLRTGSGLWWTQPYNVSPSGFSYYVIAPRKESVVDKDMVFIVTGTLA